MQKRTLATALALAALIALLMSSSGAHAADLDTEIRYYRMNVYTGADANGTLVKVLAPQQDMSYPKNCTLYLVAANYGDAILEIRAGGEVLGTVAPRDMSMITFTTPAGSASTYPLEFSLAGVRALVISYQLTSVSFEIYNEIDLPGLEEMQKDWEDRLDKERSLRERNTTVAVDPDLIKALEAAREPIIISAVLALAGIFAAFAVKWASRLLEVLNGINYLVLITAAVILGLFDAYTGLLKGNPLYFMPFVVAYLGTYYLYKIPTVHNARLDISEHRLTIGGRVYYEDDDGRWCEAVQTWRAVLARWIRGDRCIVTANGSLVPDWKVYDEDAEEENPLLMVNFERVRPVTKAELAEEGRLGRLKSKLMGAPGDTHKDLNLAKGGQFSHVDYLVNPEGWTKIMQENQRQFQAIHRLLSSIPTLARSLSEEIIEYIHGYQAEEPTRLFRTFIIRTLQRDPMAMIDGDVWERYLKFKDDRAALGRLVGELDDEIRGQDRPLDREDLRNGDRSAGHMGTSPGKGVE